MNTHIVKFDRPLRHATIMGVDDTRDSLAADARQLELANHKTIELLLNQMTAQVAKLHSQQLENIQQLKSTSVQLAGIIVEKIVGNSDSIKAERLEQLLGEALDKTETPICVRVHPNDQATIDAALERADAEHRQLNIVADQTIAAGECCCQYTGFDLTSDLAQHIESIEQRLLEVIHD